MQRAPGSCTFKRAACASARVAQFAVYTLLLLGTVGLYTTALNVVHYENGSGVATTWASELTTTCAGAGCAEPFASSRTAGPVCCDLETFYHTARP